MVFTEGQSSVHNLPFPLGDLELRADLCSDMQVMDTAQYLVSGSTRCDSKCLTYGQATVHANLASAASRCEYVLAPNIPLSDPVFSESPKGGVTFRSFPELATIKQVSANDLHR